MMHSVSIGPMPRSAQYYKTYVLAKFKTLGAGGDLDKLTSGLYCTSFPHLLQLCIGCIETFLFTGNEANLTAGTATKPCHVGAGAVGSAVGLGMELAARRGKHCRC
ncbi:MAG: hypothetical protein ACLSTW_04400 [Faecalibacterium sp.]